MLGTMRKMNIYGHLILQKTQFNDRERGGSSLEFFFTLLIYGLLAVVLGVPAMACSGAVCFFRNAREKETFWKGVAIAVVIELLIIGWFSSHPAFVCPEEYRGAISQENQARLVDCSAGIYSLAIPAVPVKIEVQEADEYGITAITYYWPFGTTETNLPYHDIPSTSKLR